MNQIIRCKVLLLCLVLIAPFGVKAQFDWVTNVDGVSVTIIDYTGADNAVTIPAVINGLPVTGIGDSAFFYTSLTSVSIPDSVAAVGNEAFFFCNNLATVKLPSGLTSIPEYAFGECSALTNIAIPGSVTNIGNNAFEGCFRLSSVAPANGVTTVGDNAFHQCSSLTNFTSFTRLVSIGSNAFAGSGFTSISIPNGVKSIGFYAFGVLPLTNSVTIPAGVTNIVGNPFGDCIFMPGINVDAANQYYSSVGGVLFDKNKQILIEYPAGKGGSYSIPTGVVSVADSAFSGTTVSGVVFPDTLTNIGAWAFFQVSVGDLALPNSVTSLGDDAFNQSRLGTVMLSINLTSIGTGVFEGSSLTQISIPNSITNIGDEAFDGCYFLASVSFPETLINIGYGAFGGCRNLQSVTIPKSVVTIGDYAFSDQFPEVCYFEGNAPAAGASSFGYFGYPTLFYLPGTTGWPPIFGGALTELWDPQAVSPGFSAGQFGFGIAGPVYSQVVVEACTNLTQHVWFPVSTNSPDQNGMSSFSDPQSSNGLPRFYRFRSP